MSEPDPEGEMLFKVLHSSSVEGAAARVGRLAFPHRRIIDTPNFIAVTSRGGVPHMTPDVITKHTQIAGVYMALEDFIEKSQKRVSPAIFNVPRAKSRPLHFYTATPPSVLTVLGARRHPAVLAPMGNGQNYVSIFTATGFQTLKLEDFGDAVVSVKPDITIPLADLTFGDQKPNAKRQIRMAERTEDWVDQFFKALDEDKVLKSSNVRVFAPLLPVTYSMQWDYLNHLSEDHADQLSGLALYDSDILVDLGAYPRLMPLARLSLDSPPTPHQVLRQVHLGVDVFALPFVNNVSDSGIAMTFTFPTGTGAEGVQPLGIDMWSEENQAAVRPLLDGCTCYTCTKHHRAYLHHLLNAKEMLGWVLLQIHNHHVTSHFFGGIRAAIADGSFEERADEFNRSYEPEFPEGTGLRPRARGYHLKTEAGQPKMNKAPWKKLDDNGDEDRVLAGEVAGLAMSGTSVPGAETPVVPDGDAQELKEHGFANVDMNA